VKRTVPGLDAPQPVATGSDATDPSTTAGPASDASPGSDEPRSPDISHEDVRATARRRTSGWLGRWIGVLIAGMAVGGALLLW
jgi:hypothetical protein